MARGVREISPPGGCTFWGKFVPDGPRCLPLAAHCLDVGLVFRGLYDLKNIRRGFVNGREAPLSGQQLDRLAVLAMLHDAGKASLGFQRKTLDPGAPRAGHVRELAPLLDFDTLNDRLHEVFMQVLPSGFAEWFADEDSAYNYLRATFSHRGKPLRFKGDKTGIYVAAREQWWKPQGSLDPMAAVVSIVSWARSTTLANSGNAWKSLTG